VPYVYAERLVSVGRGYRRAMADRSEEIDDTSGIPRYVQVARIIEAEIRTGVWQPGQAISSQVTISQEYGIARTTAGKAHALLAERGLVTAVPGVGMVVLPKARWSEPEKLHPCPVILRVTVVSIQRYPARSVTGVGVVYPVL
jgi:DNA-binding transcriptional regulator YhcF (GntR family)